MIYNFPEPKYTPGNYNIFEVMSFRMYQALPRWHKQDPDPMFMTNLYRKITNIAWHSRFRTVYPHSLQYRALRAITINDMEALTKVLKNPHFDINSPIDRKYNLTALQYAAMKNNFPVIELLLMFGAKINLPDEEGNTPLMMAVCNQSLEAVNSLLKNGCDRDLANEYGVTPAQKANSEQMKFLGDFINEYPRIERRFPKFRVNLDIEKKVKSRIWDFLENYPIYNGQALKSPFNNYKGDYKILFHNFIPLSDLLQKKE